MPKDFFGFGVRFGLRIFSFFSIRFSVFVENNSGFSVLLSNVVFGFSYLRVSEVFGFGRIFWRFWVIFSSVLRFLILYTPMPPSVSNETHSMMSSDLLRVALLLHAPWHGKKRS